ncbi:MAG: enoyl-CoA hydratase/isomerase family protein [Pseudomonadota bacterium]
MIDVTDKGPVRTLRIDRPGKANALTAAMLRDLASATQSAPGHVLILTGTGRTFSAGADLDEMSRGLATDPAWEGLSSAIAAFPGLSIAALNGTLAGGAFGMAIASDLRVAADHAAFFYPVMRLGYLPQPSDPARLAALVGSGVARRLLLCAERLNADEALAAGLVDKVVPADDVLSTASSLAEAALAASPAHVAAIKGMLQ